MMALTNAERQQAWRDRQKAAAAQLVGPPDQGASGDMGASFITRSVWYNTRFGDWVRGQKRLYLAEAGDTASDAGLVERVRALMRADPALFDLAHEAIRKRGLGDGRRCDLRGRGLDPHGSRRT
jgi:hypothetical protein